ncbi:MAG: extracellular solute-binding protein [Nitratireductor sp.]|nr:extracellular solute-binding protein [Nitratireductor sp.]
MTYYSRIRAFAAASAAFAALSLPGVASAQTKTVDVFSHRYPFSEYYIETAMQGAVPGYDVRSNLSTFQQFGEKVRIGLASGSDELDLIHCQGSKVREYGKNDWLEPIDDLWEKYRVEYQLDDIPENIVNEMRYDGKLYGFPFGLNTMFFFYRKDLFDEKGVKPPTTMEEYVDLAKAFNTPQRSGSQLTLQPVETALNELHWHFNAAGPNGWLDDKTFKPTFNQPQGVKAIELVKELSKYSPPGYLTNDNNAATVNFQQGLATMGLQWASRAKAMDNPEQSKVVGKIDFAPPPGGGSRVVVIGFCLPSSSDIDREVRFRILAEASKAERMRGGADFSIPSRLSVLSDSEIQKSNRHFAAAIKTIETARDYPPVPEYSEVGEILVRRVHQALSDEMPVQDALDEAAGEVTELLRKRGYDIQ